MNLVFASVLIIAVLQTALAGFHLPLLISYIGRMMFLCRMLGTVINVKYCYWMELAHLFFLFIGLVFNGSNTDWRSLLLNIAGCALTALLYFIDDKNYLYVVEDDVEEDDK